MCDAVETEDDPSTNPDPLCTRCGHGHMPEDSCHTTSNETRPGLDVQGDAPTIPRQAIEAAAEALYVQQTKYRADLILEGIAWVNLEGPWRSDMLSEARVALSAALPYLGARPTRPPRPPACQKCDALWTPGHVCEPDDRLAEAWDEGHEICRQEFICSHENPYRAAHTAAPDELTALAEQYVPTIKRQLECADRTDCPCTFCEFIAELRALLAGADDRSTDPGTHDWKATGRDPWVCQKCGATEPRENEAPEMSGCTR